jgi:hypothetical protein
VPIFARRGALAICWMGPALSPSVGWHRDAAAVAEAVSVNPTATAPAVTRQASARTIAAQHSVALFGAVEHPRPSAAVALLHGWCGRVDTRLEQFDNRQLPFGGDYLWITSLGDLSFGTWTDWRNTVQGVDPREQPEDEDFGTADVEQCRNVLTTTDKKGNTIKAWSSDLCPHAGGIDQDIYGDKTP